MKPRKLLISIISAAFCLAACSTSTSTAEGDDLSGNNDLVVPKDVIEISYSDHSQEVMAHLVGEIVESELRFPIKVERTSDATDPSIVIGGLDAVDDSQELNASRPSSLDLVKTVNVGTKRAWYVPDYLLESFPNLTAWSNLTDPNVQVSLGASEVQPFFELALLGELTDADSLAIANSGLPITPLALASQDALETYLQDKTQQSLPFVVVLNGPSVLIERNDLIPLTSNALGNCSQPCSYDKLDIAISVGAGENSLTAALAEAIDTMQIDAQTYAALTQNASENINVEQGVKAWLAGNSQLLAG